MRRVTTDEFIAVAEAALAAGVDYTQATADMMTEDEVARVRQNSRAKEILEGDLITPYVDYDDDGEETGGAGDMEWLETDARLSGRYDALGWTPPPRDPYLDLELDVEDAVWRARREHLHEGIQTLTKTEQAVVHAVFWDNVRPAEIARGLGISRQAVGQTLHRAIDRLREFYGVTPRQQREVPMRLTQDQMDEVILRRQRRKGAMLDAKFRRLREAEVYK